MPTVATRVILMIESQLPNIISSLEERLPLGIASDSKPCQSQC